MLVAKKEIYGFGLYPLNQEPTPPRLTVFARFIIHASYSIGAYAKGTSWLLPCAVKGPSWYPLGAWSVLHSPAEVED